MTTPTTCTTPPDGWACSRPAGHTGPCAATPLPGHSARLYGAINNLMAHIGAHGRVDSGHQLVDDTMQALKAIDGGTFQPVLPTEAAAMAATGPAGWKLVPEMPTKEMLAAAGAACEGRMYPASMTHGPRAQNTDRYIAMLDAAPQAPVADQAADEARMLRDLLARIHGDGGQYLDQHGLEKAVQDADEMVAKWQAGQPAEPSPAARDVLAERARQIGMEGWDFARDDHYFGGELSAAAAAYIQWNHGDYKPGDVPINWPWAPSWFKPTDLRRNLVKAAALTIAEIERLDRAAPKGDSNG